MQQASRQQSPDWPSDPESSAEDDVSRPGDPPPLYEDDLSDRAENDDADLPSQLPQQALPIRESPQQTRKRPAPDAVESPADSQAESGSQAGARSKKARFTWTLELSYELIKEIHISWLQGRLITTKPGAKGGGFLRDEYESWAKEVNNRVPGSGLLYSQCQDAWNLLKKKWKQVKWMLEEHSGASFNEETGRVHASDDNWAHLESYFGRESRWMKNKPFVLGNSNAKALLDEILSSEKATGSQMRTAEESVTRVQKKSREEMRAIAAARKAARKEDEAIRADPDANTTISIDSSSSESSSSDNESRVPTRRRPLTQAQGTARLAEAIEKGAKELGKNRPVGASDIQLAIENFQAKFAEGLSPVMKIRVADILKDPVTALVWNSTEDDLKPVRVQLFVEEIEARSTQARN